MIICKAVTKAYGDFKAVDNVSFSIESGQVVGLLGHNGAGKTTIMKMLTGYLEPSSGEVRVANFTMPDEREQIDALIGYLPENCPLYEDMLAIEYLEFMAQLRRVSSNSIKEYVLDAIKKVELGEKALSPIAHLSRGYRQRVGVAQAIVHKPKILILDEPTNGLDPSQIEQMRALVKELSKEATVIVSTHILQEVEAICDRVLIMQSGRLILDANLDQLQQGRRIVLNTSVGRDKVIKAVTSLPEVKEVAGNGAGVGGYHKFYISAGGEVNSLIPLIAKTLADNNIDIMAIYPEQRNLEAIFREVNSKASSVGDKKRNVL